MKRLSYILAAAILAVCGFSCINNDIPYPVEQVNIIAMQGKGFTVTPDDIDFRRRIVTLHLDETTDIANVEIEKTEISPADATSSRPLTGAFDLRTPVYVTLTLYQDYEWTIRAEQTIERRFAVQGQVGAAEIDAQNCIAKINVSEDVDLKHVVVTELKLGPEGVTTMTPTAAELTDFETPRYVEVSYFDVKQRWTLIVSQLHYDVLVTESDLWKNTATVAIRLEQAAADVKFEYKRATQNTWQEAVVAPSADDGVSYKASIAPEWSTGTNESGIQLHIVDPATGVFAGQTYDYRLVADGQTIKTAQFTIDGGDVIPDADMKSTTIPCFTKNGSEKTEFWGSGNNGFTPSLCTQSPTFGNTTSAKLTAAQPLGMQLLAAGNLFTGTFLYKGTDGTVSFGQKYTYTARPTAMKVKYNAKIGTVNFNKYNGPIDNGKPDKSRIFVCIIDWSERHNVKSGLSQPTGMWDPTETNNVQGSGEIIGYGSLFLSESSADPNKLDEVEIPINYYKKTDEAPAGRYTIIISCSTSAYGDYINGCTTNVMYVTDFEWVY